MRAHPVVAEMLQTGFTSFYWLAARKLGGFVSDSVETAVGCRADGSVGKARQPDAAAGGGAVTAGVSSSINDLPFDAPVDEAFRALYEAEHNRG